MLAEIIGIPDQVEFIEGQYKGHYVRTPYAYKQNISRKYIQALHVDLGQGLLQLVNEVQEKIKTSWSLLDLITQEAFNMVH